MDALSRAIGLKEQRDAEGAAWDIAAAAAGLGVATDTVYRLLRIARGLAPDTAARLRGTAWADKTTLLVTLSTLPPDRQASAVEALLAESPQTVAEARRIVCGSPLPKPLPVSSARLIQKALALRWSERGKQKPRGRLSDAEVVVIVAWVMEPELRPGDLHSRHHDKAAIITAEAFLVREDRAFRTRRDSTSPELMAWLDAEIRRRYQTATGAADLRRMVWLSGASRQALEHALSQTKTPEDMLEWLASRRVRQGQPER